MPCKSEYLEYINACFFLSHYGINSEIISAIILFCSVQHMWHLHIHLRVNLLSHRSEHVYECLLPFLNATKLDQKTYINLYFSTCKMSICRSKNCWINHITYPWRTERMEPEQFLQPYRVWCSNIRYTTEYYAF